MQIINELENTPRRIYTGCIGFIEPGRHAQFNVAIRTVLIDKAKGSAEYGVGGGILYDSTPESEYEECRTKALILTRRNPVFSILETMLWTPEEGFFLLDMHLRRLCDSARYFGFRIDEGEIPGTLKRVVASLPPVPHRIRLLLSKDGNVQVEGTPLTEQKTPLKVCLAKTPVDSANPFLYHKTTFREVYDKALAECPNYDDVILWNNNGEITESCIANIVFEINRELFTPPVSCGLLPGTYRAHLLGKRRVKERVIKIGELTDCSKILLVNSVRGEWQVTFYHSPRCPSTSRSLTA